MQGGARRLLSRLCRAWPRRAGLAVCVGLMVPVAGVAEPILSARYTEPTTRYTHGVLGDAIEWGALELTLANGTRLLARLPDTLVFEDIAPRLADLDGDGAPEVITVESSLTQGARLAIWGAKGRLATTPHIGQPNRWLAPVGAADLDGDGRIEIAYVDRPHLAKTLRLWRLQDSALTELDSLQGVSNHRIGWDHIAGGIRSCGGNPEIILADGQWRDVMAIEWQQGRWTQRQLAPYAGPDSLSRALECN